MLAPGGRRVWDRPGSRPRRHARTHAPFPLSFPCAKRGGGQARAERAASDQRFMESMRIATSGRRACLSRAFTAARRPGIIGRDFEVDRELRARAMRAQALKSIHARVRSEEQTSELQSLML